jgi:hypothetical protein
LIISPDKISLKPLDRIFDYTPDGRKRAIKKAGISYFKDTVTNIVSEIFTCAKSLFVKRNSSQREYYCRWQGLKYFYIILAMTLHIGSVADPDPDPKIRIHLIYMFLGLPDPDPLR